MVGAYSRIKVTKHKMVLLWDFAKYAVETFIKSIFDFIGAIKSGSISAYKSCVSTCGP